MENQKNNQMPNRRYSKVRGRVDGVQLVPKRNKFRFPNSVSAGAKAGSEVQIATLPADQQEPARKEWEKVLRPFKRREPWL